MPLQGTYLPSSTDWVREQAETYEATDGAQAGAFRGLPIIVMTTVGARSGALRKNPLMRVEHHGEYAVVASNGGAVSHPTWYANVVAHPHVELQDGAVRRDYLAHEATGEEKAVWWDRAVAAYPDFVEYQAGVEREIPLFVLVPIDGDVPAGGER